VGKEGCTVVERGRRRGKGVREEEVEEEGGREGGEYA